MVGGVQPGWVYSRVVKGEFLFLNSKNDGKISLMPLHVKTADCCRHLCKYFKRLWFWSLVGKVEAVELGHPT